MDELSKPTKNLRLQWRSPDRDLNPGPPEYEAGMPISAAKNR
jgi:hypothetical protein